VKKFPHIWFDNVVGFSRSCCV